MTPLAEYRVAGDGPRTLLFLHGLGGDHTNWQPQLAEFAPAFRCVSWTMPGFGDSPALLDMTWPTLAGAVARVLDDVGSQTATVVGLSMGGYIAQQFAADYPDRVDQLILAATTSQFGRGSTSFADKFLAARLAPIDQGQTPADFAGKAVANLLSADAPESASLNATASMSRISAAAYRQALGCLVTWNFTTRTSEIVAPTLCLAGASDATAPPIAVQALAESLSNAQLHVIDDCQHLMNLDRPTAFNHAVRTFLH